MMRSPAIQHFIYGMDPAEACQKVVRYVDLAETFHLPIVYRWIARIHDRARRGKKPPPSSMARACDGGGQSD
jgi:hypothetical protein